MSMLGFVHGGFDELKRVLGPEAHYVTWLPLG